MIEVAKMYGVVLWADKSKDRAVIWCEDHGDLAFFRGEGPHEGAANAMVAGDLIQFEVNEGRDMRLAKHPKVVSQKSFPSLTGALKRAGRQSKALCQKDVGGASKTAKKQPQRSRITLAQDIAARPCVQNTQNAHSDAMLGDMPDRCEISDMGATRECDVISFQSARALVRAAEVA